MVKIQASSIDASKFFNVNDLDYPKGQYIYKYRNEVTESGQINEDVIEVAIVDKYTGELLISYTKFKDYVNAADEAYTSLTNLLTDLPVLLGFNGGGTAPTGDFIPLTGTTEGNPVSGSIQMNAYTALPNLYVESGDLIGGLSLDSTEASMGLNDTNTGDSSYLGVFSNRIFANNSVPTSRGITSDYDYTANITALDFVQKKYVDEQVTLQTVTTSGATTTSSITTGGLTLTNGVSGATVTFDTDNLTSDRTVTLPDTSGILAIETGIQRSISTAGTVTVVPTSIDFVLIHEAGVTNSLTIALPTSPKNNQTVTIMSVGGIVGLTITTPVGSIVGTVTTLAALTTTKFIWHSPQSKWYKI